MNYRHHQQIIILSGLILVLFLIGVPAVYFKWFRQQPTCFDGLRNQNEESVDCGGPCLSCEITAIRSPEILWIEAMSLGQNHYDLVAQVNNPNPNFGLKELNYTFKFYDGTGVLLGEKNGKDFILPNQNKYLIESNIVNEKQIQKTELTFPAPSLNKEKWQKLASDLERPSIFIRDMKFELSEDERITARASGILKNDSYFDLGRINITAVLMGEDKKIIGASKTDVRAVLAKEERYFSMTWSNQFPQKVEKFSMFADTNLFAEENFISRSGKKEKFQEYPEK